MRGLSGKSAELVDVRGLSTYGPDMEVEVAHLEQQSRNRTPSAGNPTGWPEWIAWLGAAFAVLSNAVGVAEVATANRLVLSLAAGTLAVAVGGFWLWRLVTQGGPGRVGKAIFTLNLAIVVIGAGVLGGAVVGKWGAAPPGTVESAHPPATPATSGEPAETDGSPSPGQSAAVKTKIEFLFPQFGYTFADGQDANGRVTGMPVGAEVWLLVRPEGDASMSPQGPCRTDNATWICVQVRLKGPAEHRVHVLTVVVVPADVAVTLHNARDVRTPPSGALASDEIIVYG